MFIQYIDLNIFDITWAVLSVISNLLTAEAQKPQRAIPMCNWAAQHYLNTKNNRKKLQKLKGWP